MFRPIVLKYVCLMFVYIYIYIFLNFNNYTQQSTNIGFGVWGNKKHQLNDNCKMQHMCIDMRNT